MRITNSMMTNQFLRDTNRSLNRLAKVQQQIETTKRINNIDDDPLATIASLKARNRLSALANYQSALGTADSYLTQAESSAADINDLLQRAYELMGSANSGAKGPEEFEAIAQEIDNLREELLAIGNTTVGSSYIFGGETVTQPPFSMEGDGHLIYNGLDMNNLGLEMDYNKCVENIGELTSEIQDLYIQLNDDAATDYFAKNSLCTAISEKLSALVVNAETAYKCAEEYSNHNGALGGGLTAGNPDKLQALNDVIVALRGEPVTDENIDDPNRAVGVLNKLIGEMTQPLLPEDPDSIPDSEKVNCFDREKSLAIVKELEGILGISTTPAAKTPVEETATTGNNLKGSWGIDHQPAEIAPDTTTDPDNPVNGVKINYSNYQDIAYDNYDNTGTPIESFDIKVGDTDAADGKLTFVSAYGAGNREVTASVDISELSYDADEPIELEFIDKATGELCYKVNVSFDRILIDPADPNAVDFDLANLQDPVHSTSTNAMIEVNYNTSSSLSDALVGARLDYTKHEVEVSDNMGGTIKTTIGELLDVEKGAVADLKIGAAATMNISANGVELLGTGTTNYFYLLDKCSNILRGKLDQSLMGDMIGEIQDAMSENSTLRTRFGASLERIDMINARYTTSELAYTEQQSDAEDADLAEAITEWKTAQSVYDAALAAGAQIIQTSLLDYVK